MTQAALGRSSGKGGLVAAFALTIAAVMPAHAADAARDARGQARHLYACFSFFSQAARASTDAQQKPKLQRISSSLLVRATQAAIALDPEKAPSDLSFEQQLGREGRQELQDALAGIDKLPQDEADARIGAFVGSCG